MPDPNRPHDVTGLTVGELTRAQRELRASLALARFPCARADPDASKRYRGGTGRTGHRQGRAKRGEVVILTPGQQDRISELSNQWSFFWDKRRSIWIAAEDCPDGEQVEEVDLDVLNAAGAPLTLEPLPAQRA